MDLLTLLPSPREILRLTLSMLSSTVIHNHHRKALERRSAAIDYDVDAETGFFPRHGLPRLPNTFHMWEAALAEARDALGLGDDDSDEAVDKRCGGEVWRANIRSVGNHFEMI